MAGMASTTSIAQRAAALRRYEAWEGEQRSEREIGAVLADLGFVWSLLPSGARSVDPDPAKRGVCRMHDVLRKVARSQRP
jgi:hypothetical protein